MTLLFETVPTFEETWTKYLGDPGRYRMAIEDDDIERLSTFFGTDIIIEAHRLKTWGSWTISNHYRGQLNLDWK